MKQSRPLPGACLLLVLILCLGTASTRAADTRQATNALGRAQNQATNAEAKRAAQFSAAAELLIAALERLVQAGAVVGAQLAVGDDTGLRVRRNFGVRSPGSRAAVNDDTLFCLGSCSKPIAAACVMSLAEKSKLSLDQPIDRWLPGFGHLKLGDGRPASRAPTMRELLAHRAGIYSQKERMTAEQNRWIRDFTLTLAQSVDGIAGEPLIAQPGERYAYSGAGYCVLGRVAEVAAGRSLEALLQEQLGQPLDWRRTTYFPGPRDANVAAGGARNDPRQADPQIPHAYGAKLRLPLVGGSLYSTATETGQFARMILRQGRGVTGNVLSEATWKTIVQRPYPGQAYGLGWFLSRSKSGTTAALQHTGALASGRSMIDVQLSRNVFVVVHYTLAVASAEAGPASIPDAVQQTLVRLDRMEKAR